MAVHEVRQNLLLLSLFCWLLSTPIIIVLCIIIPFNVHDALNAVYNNASELLRKLTKYRLYNYCVHADICQV